MEMSSLLSCPVCLKPHFQGVDALRSSLINVATTHISCPVCNELLLGLDKLTIHLFSHISTSNKVPQPSQVNEIEIEKKATSEDHFNSIPDIEMAEKSDPDLSTVEEKEAFEEADKNCWSCDICNFHFSDETILDLHQKLLHQTSPDRKTGRYNYHCHMCSKQFKMRGSLMVHFRVAHFGFIQNRNVSNHHNDESNYCDNNVDPNDIRIKTNNEVMHNITDTNKSAGEVTQIIVMPSQQGQVEKRKNISASAKGQDNKQWECEVCLKLFTTKYFLKKHKRLHTGEMPYYCSQCNKYFTFQQSYHKHMLYHSDDKPHICTECGRAFKELSTLHNHERIHSGERPFSCETCGKCFRQRVSYLVHRRIHTGAMPYKCTACNKSFRYKVSQRSHKCPINPPGCVVRTPDLVEKLIQNQKLTTRQQSTVKFDISNEDLNCINQNINVEVKNLVAMDTTLENFNFLEPSVHLDIQKDSNIGVVENYLQQNEIECSKEQSNGNSAVAVHKIDNQEFVGYNSDNAQSPKGATSLSFTSTDNGNPDFFALILSPVLSDVQSLCLSNYSSAQQTSKKAEENTTGSEDALQTINEESFKELLYGPSST